MKEIFRLDEAQLPTMPTPHDCIIQKIRHENDTLVFVFEDDISRHDAIQAVRPSAQSLTITYHLTDDCELLRRRWNKFRRRTEYIELKNKKGAVAIVKFCCSSMAFLCQYVAYGQVMVKLWQGREEYLLTLHADSVAYDWRE